MPLDPSIYSNTQVASVNPLLEAATSMFDPDVKAARKRATNMEQTGLAQQQEKLANQVLGRTLPQVNAYLDAGDPQGALAALQSGRKALLDAGMEVPESPIARYLEQGDVKTAQKLANAFSQRLGKSDQYGGNLVSALDEDGNPVFLQSNKAGGARVLDGFRPPKTAAEIKQEQTERSNEGEIGALTNRANLFFETLNDPDIQEATGLVGAAKGALGRKTGSRAGVLSGRLQRLSSGLILDAAESLKGALSDRDIRFLEGTKPNASDDISLWRDWYETEYVPTVRSAAQSKGINFEELGIPETFPIQEQNTQRSQQNNTFTSSSGIQFTVK